MKQFSISKAALRIITEQLQTKGDGYDIRQLRLLTKVISSFEEKVGEYSKKIDTRIEQAQEEVKLKPEAIAEINAVLNKDLDAITNSEGKEQVTILLEDEQYNFTKEVWENMRGFRGSKEVRDIIIEADDAIHSASEVKN